MPRSIRRGVILGLILTVSPLSAQNVIQVSGGGQALEIAARGAPAGSIFVLQPGTYSTFIWQAVDATIIAPQRASLSGYFFLHQSARSLTMVNVDVVRGTTAPRYSGQIASSGVDLILDHCTAEGLRSWPGGTDIAVHSCRIGPWDAPVELFYSNAVFTDTTIFGGIFAADYGSIPAFYAMSVQSSTVRMERVSIQAWSPSGIAVVPRAVMGLGVFATSNVLIADSELSGGPAGATFAAGLALSVAPSASVTLSNTTLATGSRGPVTFAPLATAEWNADGLSPGNTVTAVFHDTPVTPVAVLLSTDFVSFTTPVFAEPLFVLGTPNWGPLATGLTNAQGDFSQSLTIPNVAGVQYQSIWLTGAFLGGLPFRSTAPIGGIIR